MSTKPAKINWENMDDERETSQLSAAVSSVDATILHGPRMQPNAIHQALARLAELEALVLAAPEPNATPLNSKVRALLPTNATGRL